MSTPPTGVTGPKKGMGNSAALPKRSPKMLPENSTVPHTTQRRPVSRPVASAPSRAAPMKSK